MSFKFNQNNHVRKTKRVLLSLKKKKRFPKRQPLTYREQLLKSYHRMLRTMDMAQRWSRAATWTHANRNQILKWTQTPPWRKVEVQEDLKKRFQNAIGGPL